MNNDTTRKGQTEPERLEQYIDAATTAISDATVDVFSAALSEIEAKKKKVDALNARRDSIPKDLAALDSLEARGRRLFAESITDEERATKAAKELASIHARRQELEMMLNELGKIIPEATGELNQAKTQFKRLVEEHVSHVLESKVQSIIPLVDMANEELKGWDSVVQNMVKAYVDQGVIAWVDGQELISRLHQVRCMFRKVPCAG
ncbi:MAG: hypothetical protein EOM03_19225 [Clostridia bacterium]|nr:hypothetical protein [Clostridia bacterium]